MKPGWVCIFCSCCACKPRVVIMPPSVFGTDGSDGCLRYRNLLYAPSPTGEGRLALSSSNGNLSTAPSSSFRHVLQCPPFGLAYGSPHEGQGQHGGHRIESVSAGETDGMQQWEERDGHGEVPHPVGGARDRQRRAAHAVGKHPAEQSPH